MDSATMLTNETLYEWSDAEFHEPPWAEIIAGSIMSALTVLFNSVLLLSILLNCWHRASHFNLQVASFSLSHLVLGATTLPIKIDSQVWGYWRHSAALCLAWVVLDYLMAAVSLFVLLALAVDRFLKVLGKGFEGKARRAACVLFLLLPWLVACLLVLPLVLVGNVDVPLVNDQMCIVSLAPAHSIIIIVATFIVPGCFIIVLDLSAVICWVVSSNSRLSDRDAPDVVKMKWQILSVTCVSFLTLILNAPFVIIFMLNQLMSYWSTGYFIYLISSYLALSTSVFTPLLWLMYPDVRTAVKDLVHCRLS